jgi:hypothetical protein
MMMEMGGGRWEGSLGQCVFWSEGKQLFPFERYIAEISQEKSLKMPLET